MTTSYVINWSPLVPLEGDILQRVWFDKEVPYQHMRVFGCLAYAHVAKDQRGKHDPKANNVYFSATVKTNSGIACGT